VEGSDKTGSAAATTFILPGTDQSVSTTKGLKINSSGKVSFNLESSAVVTLFISASQSSSNLPGLNGVAFTNDELQTVPDGFTNIRILKKELTAGNYVLSYAPQNKEICLVYLGVVMDEVKGEKLATPEITFINTTGEVTIGAVENATKVVYTTDGSMPTDESEEYTAPFTVADGTVVKAMAIGDGEAYANSSVAEVEVILSGLTVEAPVFTQFNGTFALSTATTLASCEYTLDGENWTAYTMPVTLTETTVVKARAARENWTTSDVVEATIEALPAIKEGTKQVLLGGGAFELTNDKKTLSGKAEGEAEGYSLSLEAKTWTITKDKITLSEGLTRTAYYGSNGAEVTVALPEHIHVYRITFYSYLPTVGRASGWDMVAGETNNSATLVPMQSQDPATPDVRIFNVDNLTGSFTFKNTGERPNFVMALDVIDDTENPNISGVEVVEATAAAAVYYNLQGQPVANPAAGLYIRVQGNDVKKVLVK
ncbi:MAG: chitobiase/beta-hexosaminidase C-terminal domain-containing protein, partial [Muribaculaceae bacterium]|nr:chitobiase/beta-hexosaminidase C-terminal domain-containing protein [Muribaculaceae bacterium]